MIDKKKIIEELAGAGAPAPAMPAPVDVLDVEPVAVPGEPCPTCGQPVPADPDLAAGLDLM